MSRNLQALESLLEREAQLLRSGNIAKLAELAPEKERVWTEVQRNLPNAAALPSLHRIQRIARANAHLLVAARAGLDAARQKTIKARQPREALQTYSAQGQKSRLGNAPNNAEIKR